MLDCSFSVDRNLYLLCLLMDPKSPAPCLAHSGCSVTNRCRVGLLCKCAANSLSLSQQPSSDGPWWCQADSKQIRGNYSKLGIRRRGTRYVQLPKSKGGRTGQVYSVFHLKLSSQIGCSYPSGLESEDEAGSQDSLVESSCHVETWRLGEGGPPPPSVHTVQHRQEDGQRAPKPAFRNSWLFSRRLFRHFFLCWCGRTFYLFVNTE